MPQPNLLRRLPGRGPVQILEEFENCSRQVFAHLDATIVTLSKRRLQSNTFNSKCDHSDGVTCEWRCGAVRTEVAQQIK